MQVESDSPLVGKTIESAGLRHLPGLFLAEIDRDGNSIPAVSPRETLRAGDRLLFVGVVESIVELQRIRGLVPATEDVFHLKAPRGREQYLPAYRHDNSRLAIPQPLQRRRCRCGPQRPAAASEDRGYRAARGRRAARRGPSFVCRSAARQSRFLPRQQDRGIDAAEARAGPGSRRSFGSNGACCFRQGFVGRCGQHDFAAQTDRR
ncbi:MAG: TrkA C-terminal domain-containing protein [Planctomycetia bacterium]|nr:TrkA C-terminal domain-containing protein [Planctomycetia bacterium]